MSIVVWGVSGPIFGYSDTWQLVINTSTTVVTFLMVFLIQNSQTRDSDALHLKIDELLRALKDAHTDFADLEDRSDEEIRKLRAKYIRLAEAARKEVDDPVSRAGVQRVTGARRAKAR